MTVVSDTFKRRLSSLVMKKISFGINASHLFVHHPAMLVDEIDKTMQMGKQTDLILLYFSKAFDKVAHEKLILRNSGQRMG